MIGSTLTILSSLLGVIWLVTITLAPEWSGLGYLFFAFGLLSVVSLIFIGLNASETSFTIKAIAAANILVFIFLIPYLTTSSPGAPTEIVEIESE